MYQEQLCAATFWKGKVKGNTENIKGGKEASCLRPAASTKSSLRAPARILILSFALAKEATALAAAKGSSEYATRWTL